MAEELEVSREQISVLPICPKCYQTGVALWEEAALQNPDGLHRTLVSLTDGFYHRVRKNLIKVPEIICDSCGTVQPD
jgi:hypothetical protein